MERNAYLLLQISCRKKETMIENNSNCIPYPKILSTALANADSQSFKSAASLLTLSQRFKINLIFFSDIKSVIGLPDNPHSTVGL